MENFVCDNAQTLWNIFAQTGDIRVYLLYSAIQHNKYADLYLDEQNTKDDGMEL